MSPNRGPDGKFLPANPDDDTFVTISNQKIYEEILSLGRRVGRIESKISGLASLFALFVPASATVAAVATTYYYLKGH